MLKHRCMVVLTVLIAVSAPIVAFAGDVKPTSAEATVLGNTMYDPAVPGYYERVALSPPTVEKSLALQAPSWDLTAEAVAKLLQMNEQERWRTIERRLLPESDVQASEDNSLPRANDRFLWGEVAEAMFSSIASARQLTPTTGARPFDLVVSFPSGDKPDVALTFGEKEEIETRKQVLDTITGVEGFVVQDGKGGVPGIMVTLTGPGSEHGFAPQTTDQRGYFLFSRVSVDPDLGSEFTVKAHQVDPEKILSETKLILERGRRARVLFHVPIVPESKGPTGAGTAQLVDAVLGGLPGTFPGLAEAMKKQALRVGVAFGTNDDSVETIYSIRGPFKPARRDLGPKAVPGARMRLERWSSPDGTRHYLRILLIGTATKRDLSLASRGWIREPAGWMIGYAPGGDPSLTLVGLSYELGPWFDLFGAYGFGEKDEDTERRWLFGASLNLTRFLKGLTEALPEGEQ